MLAFYTSFSHSLTYWCSYAFEPGYSLCAVSDRGSGRFGLCCVECGLGALAQRWPAVVEGEQLLDAT